MSILPSKPTTETLNSSQEFRLLISWVSSINLPSCAVVTNFNTLQQGVALNDISSLILNCPLSDQIHRHNIDSALKIKHNFKCLLKALKPVLPSHLSLLKANELATSHEKLFVLLRWMIKVLDFAFYKQLKSSFNRFYSKGIINQGDLDNLELAKAKSLGKMLKTNENRIKKPEVKDCNSLWCLNNIDFYSFLREIHVFNGKSQEEFLALCKTGELLADFINVLEGKHEKVKGIIRKPLWKSYKAANIAKVLRFLKDYPKMKSTFLWSDKEILAGNFEAIKGLMYDILVLYKKVPGKERKSVSMRIEFKRPSIEESSPLLMTKQSTQSLKVIDRESMKRSKISRFSVQTRSSIDSNTKVKSPREQTEFLDDSPYFSYSPTENLHDSIKEWLTSIQLGHYIIPMSSELLTDNLRNGVILCELASIICNKRPLIKYKNPKSLNEIYENIETAFKVFRKDNKIPLCLITNPKIITQDKNEAIWNLLNHLMVSYPLLTTRKARHSLSNLPYNPTEIDLLQTSLFNFILSKGIIDQLSQSNHPNCFQDLLPDIVSGVLLSDLVSQIIQKPIPGIFRVQVSEHLALSNIQKSLKPLRSLRQMGQQYLYSEQALSKGDLGVILGLLEDLHRYSDHLPARQRGENYHVDGPYLPKTKTLSKRFSFDSLNELESSRAFSPGLRLLSTSQSNSVFKCKSLNETPLLKLDPQIKGFEWLRYLGIELPGDLDLNASCVQGFRSGELLAKVVGKLEGKRIPGISKECMVQAACLHNLEKVFEVLRNKATFPSYLCFCEEAVYKGEGIVIREVLKEIYRIYRRTINNMKTYHSKKTAFV